MDNQDTIRTKIQKELEETPYACSELHPLTGGVANFLYRGVLHQPLPDDTREVVIKHGEEYVASNSNFKLTATRCLYEVECLKALSSQPPTRSKSCLVRTPRLLHFNPDTNTQILELLPNAVTLKAYGLSHLASTQQNVQRFSYDIGYSLGKWLCQFHEWVADPAQHELRANIKGNVEMQGLKFAINYPRLVSMVDKFPDILEEARDIFQQVKDFAQAELADEDRLQVIHGDFWTGNALLRDEPCSETFQPLIFITDWELCSLGVKPLDLGQMIAEMYELYLFKDIKAGIWLVDGFAAGYGIPDDDFAFRTAIHVGTHLVCWGSTVAGWGTEDQVRAVVAKGKDLILKGWGKDRAWFLDSDLASLFRKQSP